jgi:hypothetical protein
MIIYTEKNLDLAWHEDCKFRSKIGEQWLGREDYRRRFEEELDEYIAGLKQVEDLDIIIPKWITDIIDAEINE